VEWPRHCAGPVASNDAGLWYLIVWIIAVIPAAEVVTVVRIVSTLTRGAIVSVLLRVAVQVVRSVV
jgi:hypothetical protein